MTEKGRKLKSTKEKKVLVAGLGVLVSLILVVIATAVVADASSGSVYPIPEAPAPEKFEPDVSSGG